MGVLQRRRKSECPISQGLVQGNASVELHSSHKDANDDYELSDPPSLRRAGSSIDDFMSSFDDERECGIIPSKASPLSGEGLTVFATLVLQLEGMTADFCKNGLPWEGPMCRSKMAGLSGIMYALPALVAAGHPYDQIMWTVQAILSILADYFYICQDSVWHGIDRYFAICNALTIISRVSVVLSWQMALVAIIPMGCFVGANRAKNQRNIDAWHVWHCLWHVSGGSIVALVVYMLHNWVPSSGSGIMS